MSTRASASRRARRADPTSEFRQRMETVGRLVRDGLGLEHDLEPARLMRDAYRIVVALIIETLATSTEAIPTDELAKVGKLFAELRKVDVNPGRSESNVADSSQPKPLPDSFERIVNDIYGTNLSRSNGSTD